MQRLIIEAPAPAPAPAKRPSCLLFKSECDHCGYCAGGPMMAVCHDELQSFVLACLRCSLCQLPQLCDTCVNHKVLIDFSMKHDFSLSELDL